MQSTFTLEGWIFILRVWRDETYPLDQGKSQKKYRVIKLCFFQLLAYFLGLVWRLSKK